eukprot:9469286-Pyramimonas_sp.AAC.1
MPLASRFTTGEFNSPSVSLPTPKKRRRWESPVEPLESRFTTGELNSSAVSLHGVSVTTLTTAPSEPQVPVEPDTGWERG